MAARPVVFLAFANALNDLRELREESRKLQELFETLRDDGRCRLICKDNATWDQIYRVLTNQPDDIAIFHYGGHAAEGHVLLDNVLGPTPIREEGLAALLGRRDNLKLVFLNGCSTAPQVRRLLDAGVPAVIATARSIPDRRACELAVKFYEALTAGGDAVPAGGRNLKSAFEAARAYALGLLSGAERNRDFEVEGQPAPGAEIADASGLPWALFPSELDDKIAEWDLFTADPLFGLPGLPKDIGWPDKPFRGLHWFTREEARVFFGRGREIRELYDKVTRTGEPGEADILLYCGQTGVGKSSVLDAGVLPRLEQDYRVFPTLRRSAERGLLGTLREALQPDADRFDLRATWLRFEHEAVGRPLILVLDQAEEAFTQPLKTRQTAVDGSIHERVDPAAELAELCAALRTAFGAGWPEAQRPRGKLILGFRKEWLDEFVTACKAHGLAWERVSLYPLDRAGVAEAIRGPASGARPHLKIRDEDPPLPEFIADDLLDTLADPRANRESPVAPTFQLLLTRMWNEAVALAEDQPVFDRALYIDLKKRAYELDKVIKEQFEKIAKLDAEAVNTGLLIDLLNWFTTELNTAAAHTRAELHARYGGQPHERLDALLRSCQLHYLLVETSAGTDGTMQFRLAHDSLAPLIRNRFQVSMDVLPRAHRTIDNRTKEWTAWKAAEVAAGRELGPAAFNGVEPLLEPYDLGMIIKARPLMPTWTLKEEELVTRSGEALTEAKFRDRRRGKVLRGLRILAGAGLVVASVAAIALWRQLGLTQTERNLAQRRLQNSVLTQVEGIAQTDPVKAQELLRDRDVFTYEERDFAWGIQFGRCAWVRSIHSQGSTKYAVAYSADGRTIAAGCDDGSLQLWDAANGRRRGPPIPAHEGGVRAVAFSPDGRILATVGYDGKLRLWDTTSEEPRGRSVSAPEGDIMCVAFSVDGRMIATGGLLGKLLLWEVVTDELHLKRSASNERFGNCMAVAFSVDGRTIATGGDLGKLQFWHWNATYTDMRFDEIQAHDNEINSMAFSPDGQTLATGGNDGKLKLWDATRGTQRGVSIQAHKGVLMSLAYSVDGRTIATVGWDRVFDPRGVSKLRLWDAATGQERRQPIHVHDGGAYSVAFSPDGQTLATGGGDYALRIWKSSLGEPRVPPVQAHKHSLFSLAFSPDGRTIATGGDDRNLRLWNSATGSPELPPIEAHKGGIAAVAINRDGETIATGGRDGEIDIWVATTGALRRAVPQAHKESVHALAFSADGRIIASGGGDDKVRFWDAETGEPRGQPISTGEEMLFRVLYSLDGRFIATLGSDYKLKQWDAATGAARGKPIEPHLRVSAVAFSRDGRTLATGYDTGHLQLWDTARGAQRCQPIQAHAGTVQSVAFSVDGRALATGGDDGVLQLWDSETGESRGPPIQAHERSVYCLAFSPDGRTLASGGYDGKLRLWIAEFP